MGVRKCTPLLGGGRGRGREERSKFWGRGEGERGVGTVLEIPTLQNSVSVSGRLLLQAAVTAVAAAGGGGWRRRLAAAAGGGVYNQGSLEVEGKEGPPNH